MLRRSLLLAGLTLPAAAAAQAPQLPRPPDGAALVDEVMALRETIRAAIAAKDRATLERVYSANFNHLRDTGRVDLKGERIDLLLTGEVTIETAPEENLVVQVYGPATVAATGMSPIPDPAAPKPALFRWVVVYAKTDDGWKVALSQASRMNRRRR